VLFVICGIQEPCNRAVLHENRMQRAGVPILST
jgi:hypothetical protein